MTTQRLIQNFRKSQGLLWAGPDFHAETLERSLAKLGVSLAWSGSTARRSIPISTSCFSTPISRSIPPRCCIPNPASPPRR